MNGKPASSDCPSGAELVAAFDENGEQLYGDEIKRAKEVTITTLCEGYKYSGGYAEFKAGDIIKVRSDKSVTGKDVKAYVQAHPEILEIIVKPVSVKFGWTNSNKYFPVYELHSHKVKSQILKY